MKMKELLIERLAKLHPIDEVLKEKVAAVTRITDYKAGSFVLREGQVCASANMVAAGLVRSYYLNEGKEITSRFMDEGFIATSWISFYTQKPGNEYIQAVEDTTILSVDYTDIQRLYMEYPDFNTIGRKQVEHSFFLAEQRTQMLRKHTAEEKYQFFLDNHLSLLQRVPLRQIASYLGMNEETLSRVRGKFRKKA
jgi:CRP-like cAMP-binding protein